MKNYSGDGKTVNLQNGSGVAMASGSVQPFGTGRHVVPVTDIADGEMGAAATCGVFSYAVPDGTTLAQGDDYKMVLATQVYDAGAGVVVGYVTEQVGQTAHVMLNGLPGGVG